MWLITRIKEEWDSMKKVVKIKRKRKIIKERKIMNDSDFQAGVTAAVVGYVATLSGGYPVTGFSYTYTPPVTSTPPPVTVQVAL